MTRPASPHTPRSRAAFAAALLSLLPGCLSPELEGSIEASIASANSYATQWALRGDLDVDLIEGHDTNLAFVPASAQPVVIGLLDSGIDYRHPDLAGAVWTNPGEIAGNCLDDDGNGYLDDLHGIRVDVDDFDGLLRQGAELSAAFDAACAEHGGMPSGGLCTPGAESDPLDQRKVEGLNAAHARAATALDGNPLLFDRSCPGGHVVTRAARIELARGDALDHWMSHGTAMAGTMGARSGVATEPASLLDLPAPGGGKLGDHVQIVTCAAFVPTPPAGSFSLDGVAECIDYFLDLKARGVNLVAVNMSFGVMIDAPDAAPEESAPSVVALIDRLAAADVVLVAAAGNDFRNLDDAPEHALYPAAFEHDNLLAVGGINERGTWFGNKGRHTVDVAAPAQRLRHPVGSAELAMMARLLHQPLNVPFDFMTDSSGTSQATAYMTTAVALLRANAATAHLGAPEIRRLVLASATPLPSLPWMLITRPVYLWPLINLFEPKSVFEPTTRTLKQQQLEKYSRSGRIARLDRALACQGLAFERLVSPVGRQVIAGGALRVEAESYVCAQPSASTSLSATVKLPDGTTQPITLTAQGGGRSAASYAPPAPGSYTFWLDTAPGDVLTVGVPAS